MDGEESFVAADPTTSTARLLQTIQEIVSLPQTSPTKTAVLPNIIDPKVIQQIIQSEIKTVLLVDQYDIFLGLFAKGLQSIMPHIQ
eukprot:3130379-Ditylum_brightwellii.AAC.1